MDTGTSIAFVFVVLILFGIVVAMKIELIECRNSKGECVTLQQEGISYGDKNFTGGCNSRQYS